MKDTKVKIIIPYLTNLKLEVSANDTIKLLDLLKNTDIKNVVDLLIDLKKDLEQTTGSIKDQYLMKYPEIIEKVDYISNIVINSSITFNTSVMSFP